jgi:hypothetical protein
MKFQESQAEVKFNGTCQLLAYADDVILFGDNIGTMKTTNFLMLVRRLV